MEKARQKPALKTADRSYNMIKGRVAETLIQELFINQGYRVHYYGMERIIPGAIDKIIGIKSKSARIIRQTPDFVVQNNTTGEVYFVEVKYRASGEFDKTNLDDFPYINTYFIIVSPNSIKCLTLEELKEGKCITGKCNNHLYCKTEFNLSAKAIEDFTKYAGRFFATV